MYHVYAVLQTALFIESQTHIRIHVLFRILHIVQERGDVLGSSLVAVRYYGGVNPYFQQSPDLAVKRVAERNPPVKCGQASYKGSQPQIMIPIVL